MRHVKFIGFQDFHRLKTVFLLGLRYDTDNFGEELSDFDTVAETQFIAHVAVRHNVFEICKPHGDINGQLWIA